MLEISSNGTKIDLMFNFISLELNISFPCQISIGVYTNETKIESESVSYHVNSRNPVGEINKKVQLPMTLQKNGKNVFQIKVHILIKNKKKCAGQFYVNFDDTIKNNRFKGYFPLENCPDKRAKLNMSFKYSNVKHLNKISSKKNLNTTNTSFISHLPDLSFQKNSFGSKHLNISGRKHSKSPSNVKLRFGNKQSQKSHSFVTKNMKQKNQKYFPNQMQEHKNDNNINSMNSVPLNDKSKQYIFQQDNSSAKKRFQSNTSLNQKPTIFDGFKTLQKSNNSTENLNKSKKLEQQLDNLNEKFSLQQNTRRPKVNIYEQNKNSHKINIFSDKNLNKNFKQKQQTDDQNLLFELNQQKQEIQQISQNYQILKNKYQKIKQEKKQLEEQNENLSQNLNNTDKEQDFNQQIKLLKKNQILNKNNFKRSLSRIEEEKLNFKKQFELQNKKNSKLKKLLLGKEIAIQTLKDSLLSQNKVQDIDNFIQNQEQQNKELQHLNNQQDEEIENLNQIIKKIRYQNEKDQENQQNKQLLVQKEIKKIMNYFQKKIGSEKNIQSDNSISEIEREEYIKNLREKIERSEQKIERQEKTILDYEEEFTNQETQFEKVKHENLNLKQLMQKNKNSKSISSKREIENKNKENEDLKLQVNEFQLLIENLENKLNKKKTKLNLLKSKLENFKNESSIQQNSEVEIQKLNLQHSEDQKIIKDMKYQILDLQVKIEALKEQKIVQNDNSEESAQLRQIIQQKEKQINNLESKIEEYQNQTQNEENDLMEKYNKQKDEIENLKENYQNLQQEHLKLEQNYQEKQKIVGKQDNNIQQLQTQIEQLEDDKERKNSQDMFSSDTFAVLTVENENLKKKLKVLEFKLNDFQSSEKLQSKIQQQKQKIDKLEIQFSKEKLILNNEIAELRKKELKNNHQFSIEQFKQIESDNVKCKEKIAQTLMTVHKMNIKNSYKDKLVSALVSQYDE